MRSEAILQGLESSGVRLGLDRMRQLLEVLGRPQEAFPSVLVAGTNGKGSVSTFLASFAVAAAYRTGHYTSPHLESPVERIRVDGAAVDDEVLADALSEILQAAAEAELEAPTYFEAMTLAAFQIFRRAKVHIAMLEVGLGGRLDATNVCKPILGVITPISFDHCAILGDTLAAIATEKAGIFRAGTTCVIASQEAEARSALAKAAETVGAVLVDVEEVRAIDAIQRLDAQKEGDPIQRIWLRSERERDVFELALPGRFQAENLAVAVVAGLQLEKAGFDRIGTRAMVQGAAAARWPGRCEWISLPTVGREDRRILLDAAHNPAGAVVLAEILDRIEGPFDLLFGVRRDKDLEAILPVLAAKARRLILTHPTSEMGRGPADYVDQVVHSNLQVAEDWQQGLDLLLSGITDSNEADESTPVMASGADKFPVGVVCGSIYLIGAVRAELNRRFGVPTPAAQTRLGPTPKARSGARKKT